MKRLIIPLLLLISIKSFAQTFPVTTILNNGSSSNHIDLVFLADGFTSSQQSDFLTQVNNICNSLFQASPFKEYKNLFNVYAIQVVSTQSGIKHPVSASDCSSANPNVPASSVTPYFGSTFDYGGVHRLVVATNTSAVQSVLLANFPSYNKAIVVANSSYYGGSGGTYPCCTINNASAEILIHELGHSLANLTDEYSYGGCSSIEKPNCTQQTNPNLIKWKDWIQAGTTIPTPAGSNCSSVGLYLGANYCPTTWYRPMCNCRMLSLGQAFCNICREELIYNFLNMSNLIAAYSPSNTSNINISSSSSQLFSTSVIQTIPNTIKTQWLLDNVVKSTNTSVYTVTGNSVSGGTHTLTLKVTDTTSMAKKTLPSYSISWVINVNTSVTLASFPAVCANTAAFTLTGGSPSGGTYSGTGVSNGIFNPASSGVGTFNITYTYNGQSATQPIQVKALPAISVTPSSSSVCSGSPSTLTASGATTYTWLPTSGLNMSTGASVIATPAQNATYTVTGTSNGCSNTAIAAFTVNTIPVLSVSGNLSICKGSSASLTASGALSYSWSPSTGINQTTGSSVTASPTVTTTYTITGIANNCTGSITKTVTVNPLPSITTSGNTTICSGTSTTMSASGANSYTWQPSTGLNSTTGSSVTAQPGSTSTYTVTGTSIGCSKQKTITITIGSSISVNISGTLTVCSGSSTTLTASGASTYTWAPSTGLNTSTGSAVISTPSSAITYTVTGISGSCSSTKTAAISILSKPTISITGATSLCNGSSVSMTASGASTYQWNPSTGLNSTTGSSVTASPSSNITYTVKGTASNGCTNNTTRSIVVNSKPVVTGTQVNPSSDQSNNGSINITVTGSSPFTYLWSTGATSEDLNSIGIGTYTVTVTASTGCTKSASYTLSSTSQLCAVTSSASFTTTNTNSTIAMWSVVSNAYKYNLKWKPVSSATWISASTNGANAAYTISGLTSSTAYELQIQTQCNSSGSNVSAYSGSYYFTTTSSSRLDEQNNINTEISIQEFKISIFPNPVTEVLFIKSDYPFQSNTIVEIFDIEGRIRRSYLNKEAGPEIILQVDELTSGIYFLKIQDALHSKAMKLVKQ